MSNVFKELANLGAGDFEHIDGTLIEHLNGTKRILESWAASTDLQDAGLYHAAYGTAGFDERLVSTNQRDKIEAIIGIAAEEIVYQYCACDRKDFFSKIGQVSNPEFTNRFTGESYCLSHVMLRCFCELTAANEIEIAIDNPNFLVRHGEGLNNLFLQMAPYLSNAAQDKAAAVFGTCNA